MIDFITDTKVGSWPLSGVIPKQTSLTKEIKDRTNYSISVDSNGEIVTSNDIILSVAFVDSNVDIEKLSVDNVLYFFENDNVDAMNKRIINCVNP